MWISDNELINLKSRIHQLESGLRKLQTKERDNSNIEMLMGKYGLSREDADSIYSSIAQENALYELSHSPGVPLMSDPFS